VADVWHGVAVADPYRWLETGDSPEVVDWTTTQNEYTRQALDARPDRGRWHERLSALVGLPTTMACKARGERLFVLERGRGADQFALVMRSALDAGAPARMLFDPAALAADGAVAIDWFHPSPDGSVVALGLSEGGTENSTLHLLDVDTATLRALRIPDTRAASVAWQPDGAGFWYAGYPAGDEYHRHIRHHTIGADPTDDPADDPVVFDRLPTAESWPDVDVSADGRFLLVQMMVGWGRHDAHLCDLATGEWRVVIEGRAADTSIELGPDGIVAVTTLDAPNGRLVVAPYGSPGVDSWRTVVAERDDVVLGSCALVGDEVLVTASRAAVDTVERWSLDGRRLQEVDGLGLVSVGNLVADEHGTAAFALVSSFTAPTAVWRIDRDGAQRWCPEPPASDELPPLTVSRTTYPSLDGTEIGLFIVHRADVVPSPDTPTILNGYGGFAIAESPSWMPNLAAWCAEGGVWAIAGLRGGYEYGERWHQAGRRATKQNVFDDFHSAADWMVATSRASRERLAVHGGSNGGLLVGVALTQRPDLARAVWCAVPLLDMVRYPQFLIARLWTDEYGDPDVADEFGWLHAYSPYHRVQEGTHYPAVLFTTAEGDTRVDPLHARKMAALVQHATAAAPHERPVLLLQSGRAGHGAGKPAAMRIADGVDALSFLAWQLGLGGAS
jgi:prolyl oligopeptidase